jgi:hypothetical protein
MMKAKKMKEREKVSIFSFVVVGSSLASLSLLSAGKVVHQQTNS